MYHNKCQAALRIATGQSGKSNNEKEKHTMKKVLALILALAMVLSLAACGGDGGTSKSNEGGNNSSAGNESSSVKGEEEQPGGDEQTGYLADNLNVGVSSDGQTLDPFASFVNWGNAAMTGLIYQHLIINDYAYNDYYELAKSIEQVDDTHWRLEIWDCIYDTAGNQLTIDDVIWSYQQLIDSGNAGAIPKFESWTKESDYVAVMNLNAPFGDGDFAKHFGNSSILCQKTYEEVCSGDMSTNPIGTGPYKLAENGYTVGSEVVLEVNEDYWAKDLDVNDPFMAQNFKTITYKVLQSDSSRAIALENGEIDIADSLSSLDIQNLDTEKFNTIDMPVRAPISLVLNASADSVLQSKEIRQAILYGIDNAALAAGLSVPAEAVHSLQPAMVDAPESWVTGEGRDYYDYNPEKAAELLEQAGYNGEKLVLMYTSSTTGEEVAQIIQDQLRNLGITIEPKELDMVVAMEAQYDPTQWDIRIATLGGGAYMSQVAKSWWSEDSAQHFDNGEIIAMVPDAHADELYVALNENPTEETINAWGDYIDEMAYGYSICSYANQTACIADYESPLMGNTGWGVVPNALVKAG